MTDVEDTGMINEFSLVLSPERMEMLFSLGSCSKTRLSIPFVTTHYTFRRSRSI